MLLWINWETWRHAENDMWFLGLFPVSDWASWEKTTYTHKKKKTWKTLMRFWMCDLQTGYDLQLQLLRLFFFFSKQNKYFSHRRSVHVEVWDHTHTTTEPHEQKEIIRIKKWFDAWRQNTREETCDRKKTSNSKKKKKKVFHFLLHFHTKAKCVIYLQKL